MANASGLLMRPATYFQRIAEGAAGGGLIVSSSNTIHRGVKPENYRAMLRAIRRYGKYG
ncbi:MAG: hypothetical protein ACOX1P_11645 [Thermoguttaceae bacterium]